MIPQRFREGAAGGVLVDGFVVGVDLPPVVELVEAQGVLVEVLVGDGCDGVRKVEAQG